MIGGGFPACPTRRVFLTCWLVYTALWAPFIVREHFPAIALIERGSLNVERYAGWIEDIFRGPSGGAYINNNPGASLSAALVLAPAAPVLGAVDRWNQALPRKPAPEHISRLFRQIVSEGRAFYFLSIGFLTVALLMAPATAGVMAYLCARLQQAGVSPAGAAAAALLAGLATPVLFRSEYLNHNLLAGDAGLLALLLLWDPEDRPARPGRAALAGLLAGYAMLCDYSGAVIAAAVGLYVWLRAKEKWRAAVAYAAGAFPGAAILALYQAWAFGAFYHPSQLYMTPTAPTSHGYRGFDWPSASLAWANFFDPRFGLFVYCPALLLALAAPFVKRVRRPVPPREMRVALVYFFMLVLFCAANQYSWLQPSTGFRYLVPIVPVLALLAMHTAQALPRWARWTIAAASCAESLAIAAAHQNDVRFAPAILWENGFRTPWMIRLTEVGVPVGAWWPAVFWLLLALAVGAIWWRPRRTVLGPNPSEM